ncbi:unnamed protein product [Prunus brigantina]
MFSLVPSGRPMDVVDTSTDVESKGTTQSAESVLLLHGGNSKLQKLEQFQMEEVQTSFDKILTLTADEADLLVIEEEDDVVAQDILERSLVAKIYSLKLVHKKSFKHRMLEIWDPVGEVNIKELPYNHFLFTFRHREDKQKEPNGTMAPSKMNLKFVDFWVQIQNVPLLKMIKKLAR